MHYFETKRPKFQLIKLWCSSLSAEDRCKSGNFAFLCQNGRHALQV